MSLQNLSPFLAAGLGLPTFAMPPALSQTAASTAGPSTANGGWQQTGAISFGGSGTGGATVGGAAADMGLPGTAGMGNLLGQYWPFLLLVGVVWVARRRKSR
jgi:hypothetical protein